MKMTFKTLMLAAALALAPMAGAFAQAAPAAGDAPASDGAGPAPYDAFRAGSYGYSFAPVALTGRDALMVRNSAQAAPVLNHGIAPAPLSERERLMIR